MLNALLTTASTGIIMFVNSRSKPAGSAHCLSERKHGFFDVSRHPVEILVLRILEALDVLVHVA